MLKRSKCFILLPVLCVLVLHAPSLLSAEPLFPKISVRGDKLYAGDEELLLVSVGYVHLRPGQDSRDPVPYGDFGYDLIDSDMKRIKEAGFNSIRTWDLPSEKYLELAKKHGLWVVGGIWTDQQINLSDEPALDAQIRQVEKLARIYAGYPNVAMLLVLNEPNFQMLIKQDQKKMKDYFDRLAQAARSACPGAPVSFSNWPNAAFIDPASWDVISYNLYATMPKFRQSIGFGGYIKGMKKAAGAGKPFYLSEYGFYTPTPRLHPEDAFSYNYVENADRQSEFLLRDSRTVFETPVVGGALLSWLDHWALASDFRSSKIIRRKDWIDKATHDFDCVEWSGIAEMDQDVRGLPRPAYAALSKANQAILTEPDPEMLYQGSIPISIYRGNRAMRADLIVDGRAVSEAPKTTAHWTRYQFAVDDGQPKKHSIEVRLFDGSNHLIHTMERTAWAASDNRTAQLDISQIKDNKNAVYFVFTLKDGNGRPLSGARICWGVFDAFTWKEKEGILITGPDGTCRLKRFSPSPVQLVVAGFDYRKNNYHKKITDLLIYTRR